MRESKTYIATPPGETIKEQLEDRGMSQKEFSQRMGMSEKHISRLINGEVQLTQEMAYRLETVLGVPARFWNNLEAIYREKMVKIEEENDMQDDIQLAKNYPYREMVKNGWLPEETEPEKRVAALRRFFEVARLTLLSNERLLPGIACRRQSVTEKADYALICWAQKARLEARKAHTQKVDLKGLEQQLGCIRRMTTEAPEKFCPELIALLANHGIALVLLPHIGGSFLHGATFQEKDKIVMGMTIRGKDADKFWFSLFHEIGHILLGHLNQPGGTTLEDEKEADRFAGDTLIPPEDFDRYTWKGNFSKTAIQKFAEELGIDPGIVVGRLQKERYIKFSWCNDLKTQYVWI